MQIELRALLLADPDLSALVDRRIDWGERPQGDGVPAVSLTRISGGEVYHMAGRSRFAQARVQVDCFAVDYARAARVAAAVQAALSGYRGGIFKGVFLDAARDLRSAGSNDADRLFGVSQDYMINFF